MHLTQESFFIRLLKKFAYKIISKIKIILGIGVRKYEPWFDIAKEALIFKSNKLWPVELSKLKLNGVEIGAHRGNHATSIINNLPIAKLTLIDPWSVYDGDADYFQNQNIQDSFYQETVIKFQNNDRVKIFRESSEKAVTKFDNSSLDFVYVDGDHSYEEVSRDLELWWPKIKDRGILAGDDYKFKWPGVMKAVEEFYAKYQVPIYKLGRGQFVFLKI